MKVKDIVDFFEQIAPVSFQESYDNAGLIIGSKEQEVSAILITLDVTEQVLQEAINLGANLIVSHHPIIFGGLKRLNGNNYIERTVIMAIKNNIAIFAAHTNIDSVIYNGVNTKICEKIGLLNLKMLAPVKNKLQKLVVYVPTASVDVVRKAIFNAGAGVIGKYDSCSFNVSGIGTFRACEGASPYVGELGLLHHEAEVRVETVVPAHIMHKVVSALVTAHPYEEVAYDIYALENQWSNVGMGMIGNLPEPTDEMEFLNNIKHIFNSGVIKYTKLKNKKINKVAVCGGSGSFLLKDAIKAGADIFITADFKYHEFFDAEELIVIADIGHFESEQYTKELFYELLTIKFPNFATHFTKVNTNPIKYI